MYNAVKRALNSHSSVFTVYLQLLKFTVVCVQTIMFPTILFYFFFNLYSPVKSEKNMMIKDLYSSALFVGGSFSTNCIWKNIWNINTTQNNTSVRNVEKNSHTGRLLMITRKCVPTNFRTGHRETIGYQSLSFFSVFKVIVLFYVSFSFSYLILILTFILLSCLFSFCRYI